MIGNALKKKLNIVLNWKFSYTIHTGQSTEFRYNSYDLINSKCRTSVFCVDSFTPPHVAIQLAVHPVTFPHLSSPSLLLSTCLWQCWRDWTPRCCAGTDQRKATRNKISFRKWGCKRLLSILVVNTVINCWFPDILMAVMGIETAETRASDTASETTWTLFGVWRPRVRR